MLNQPVNEWLFFFEHICKRTKHLHPNCVCNALLCKMLCKIQELQGGLISLLQYRTVSKLLPCIVRNTCNNVFILVDIYLLYFQNNS